MQESHNRRVDVNISNLRVYLTNPLSYRAVSLDTCLQLMAKFCASGSGYCAAFSTPGLGVFMQPLTNVPDKATPEQAAAIQHKNKNRPILYVSIFLHLTAWLKFCTPVYFVLDCFG